MSPGEGGLTLGERIQKIEATGETTLNLVRELDSRDRADLLRHQTHERRLAQIEERLTSWETWVIRVVVGGIVTAVTGGIVTLAITLG